MKRKPELTVITKTFDLVAWTVNHTSRFPRNHRYALGVRIETQLYDILEALVEAKFQSNRKELLEQTNRKLETVRFFLRLANQLGCLKAPSYGFASKSVDEIGRLVGGWQRSSASGS